MGVVCYVFLIPVVLASSIENPSIPGAGLAAEGEGQWQKAISIYLDALLKDPANLKLWVRVAVIEHQLNNKMLAIDAYMHAIRLQSNDPTLHKTLSEIYAEINQPKHALTEINLAVSLKPMDIDYLMARGKIANWNKDLLLALDSYQRVLAIKKEAASPSTLFLLTEIGSLQQQLHQVGPAIKTYEKAIQLNANDPRLYQLLSQLYAENNQPAPALAMMNQALKLDPSNVNYEKSIATLSLWNHQLSEKKPSPLQPSPLEKYLNISNEEAGLHHYREAAQALKEAIKLKPNAPELYKKLSEIYAMASQPKLALDAINKAIKLAPKTIDYWRARGKLASWAGDKIQMQESYEQILQLKPRDEEAMLNLAHALAWRGQTDQSIKAYIALLCLYPKNAEAWINYAEVQSWTGNYIAALNALNHYKQLQGETTRYCKTKARVLSLIGRYQSALAINTPLLQTNPRDSYLLSTQVIALTESLHTVSALVMLDKIPNKSDTDPQVKGLRNTTLTPLRSNVNLEVDYSGASDTTRILDVPVYAQYFLNPSTSLLFQGLYERATASIRSGLEAVNGHGSIFDESVKVGFTKQLEGLNLRGMAGGLKIQDKNNHGIYDVSVNTNLGEKAQITVGNLKDLFRPYLVPQTPKLISLQIIENRTAMLLQWQPLVQKYLNVAVAHASLSDNNDYTHVNVWPKERIYNSEHWQITIGVDGDFWMFRRRAMDGYYSPLHFDGYEGTVQLYYAQSENVGYSFSGGFGMQKDETFPHYFYEEDLGMQLFFGIYKDLELQVKSGFTLRDNPTRKNYKFWSTGVVLTKRM